MLAEILDIFGPVDSGVVVDATLGGGGHAMAILDMHSDVQLVGFDQDPAAIEAATARLTPHGDRVQFCHARFDDMANRLAALGIEEIAGVLFDLGVSSHQLDTADRGFSFRHDGPLDMRMNTQQATSAAHLVNEAHASDIEDMLRSYADERFARRIAKAIVAARPVASTAELADIVRDAIPAPARRTGGHPAKRTFQALRIAVNDELDALGPALDQAIAYMRPGGRGAVLSYHSGEDRIVKQRLRDAAGLSRQTPAGLPVEPEPTAIRLLKRGGKTPTADERERNPRAASARLRSFERTDMPLVWSGQ